jgi:VWFA-related protein
MRRASVLTVLFLTAYAQFVPCLAAQERTESSAITFSARTNVVLVPTIVSDKHGNQITDLKCEDFEVREDGKPQKIASCDEIRSETAPISRPNLPKGEFTNRLGAQTARRLDIIALDLVNTRFLDQHQAREALRNFIATGAEEDALVALVVMLPNSVRVIHNFTQDKSILVNALKGMRGTVTNRDTAALVGAGGRGTEEDTEGQILDAILSGQSVPLDPLNPASGDIQRRAAAALVDSSRLGQNGLVTLEDLQEIAHYFAVVPGRKSLLWASGGFQFNLGSTTGELTRGTTPQDWQRTFQALQNANIAVYPVEVSGLAPGAPSATLPAVSIITGNPADISNRSSQMEAVAAGRGNDPTQARHDTMRAVALMTGGEAFYNNNDIANLFKRATRDSTHYYMLSYATSDSGKTDWRKIEVKVNKPDVHVRSRSGFFYNKALRDPETTRQVDEVMAVTSPLNFTMLPLDGVWQQVEAAGDKRKVHFALNIPPGNAMIDMQHENRINLDVIAIAGNAKSTEINSVKQRIDRKLPPPAVSQIQQNGITYANALTLPPGQYQVHFVVRDNLTGKTGSVVAPLNVE